MKARRWWIATAAAAAIAFGAGLVAYWYVELQRPHFEPDVARIEGYAVSLDGREITIFGAIGWGDLLDAPVITEEADRIQVKLPSWRFMPARGGFKNLAAYFVQARATLRDPLGGRSVIDATTGRAVPKSVSPP